MRYHWHEEEAQPGPGGLRLPPETSLSLVHDEEGSESSYTDDDSSSLTWGSLTSDPNGSFSDMVPMSGKFLKEAGLSDTQLVLTKIKELNKLLKDKNISKDLIKEIKAYRRTLKNRGYANNCRDKREKKMSELEEQLASWENLEARLQRECAELQEELLKKRNARISALNSSIVQLEQEIQRVMAGK